MKNAPATERNNTAHQNGDPEHIALGSRPLRVHEHGPLKFARPHHQHVPDHDEPGYGHYCTLRDVTLSNAVKNLEAALQEGTPLLRMDIENGTLTVHYHSQSKLSQQELADLQKATHFDKKELQQWYKGRRSHSLCWQPEADETRLPKGLPLGHAHKGGVPEDL